MPAVTLTLTDTPMGKVAIHADFKPAAANPCSPAQAAALEVIGRTSKDYGLQAAPMSAHPLYQFKKGQALVIVGPQGTGKTVLARKIAGEHGKYQEIETGPTFDFCLRDALNAKVSVLIIDGYLAQKEMSVVKQLITNPQHTFRKPFSDAVITAPSPLVIICVQDLSWLPLDSRRFDVIDLSMGVAA